MSSKDRRRATRFASAVASSLLTVLAALALLLVLLGIFAHPGKDGVSRLAGHPVLTVLSGSMVPVFHPGDLVIDDSITNSQANRLVAGDVITFHVQGTSTSLITHRIAAVKPAIGSPSDTNKVSYQTKGDANNAADDQPVSPSQIVGTYSKHIPVGGYFLQAVQKKFVFSLLILLPLLYLIGVTVAKHWGDSDGGARSSDADVDSQKLTPTPGAEEISAHDLRALALSLPSQSSSNDQAAPANADARPGEGGFFR